MASEYDPLFSPGGEDATEELDAVRERFRAASAPYLASPWTWLTWGIVLPAAALATPAAVAAGGFAGTLLLWSVVILVGGAVESRALVRGAGSPLSSWALRAQGNLSLVALALSALLVVRDEAWALPGLWLLLLGHSFFVLGGLSYRALRRYGIAYQLGGAGALLAGPWALTVFALTTAIANLGLALAVWRRRL